MEPEAVAIRLPRIDVGPAELRGKSPVFVFAEQGLSGANLPEVPGLDDASPQPVNPQKFKLDELILVLDRSGSMNDPLTPDVRQRKLEHVQDLIARLGSDYFPETNVRLIVLSSDAKEVAIGGSKGMRDLQKEIAALSAQGGTNFSNALSLVDKSLSPLASPLGEAGVPNRRTMILFMTDGQDDRASRERAKALAESIRGKNAGVFLVGVGSDYDLRNIIELAGKFGYCGWAHTPMPNSESVFNLLVPAFLAQMQSNEHYLEVVAEGPVRKAFGITPTIREIENGACYFGYLNQGVAVYFVDNDDTSFELQVKSYQADSVVISTDIPVLDAELAAAHFEKLQIARDALGPLLVLLAQMEGNKELLGKLKVEHPILRDQIDALIATMDKQGDVDARMRTRATVSDLGTMTSMGTLVNAHSRVPRDPPGQSLPGRGGPRGPQHFHSGGLGALDDRTVGDIPPLGTPDAEAYRALVPDGHPKLIMQFNNQVQQFDLFSINEGEVAVFGKAATAKFQLPKEPYIGNSQFEIRRNGNDFLIRDVGSPSLTLLNGQQISSEQKLSNGDGISVGKLKIKVVF